VIKPYSDSEQQWKTVSIFNNSDSEHQFLCILDVKVSARIEGHIQKENSKTLLYVLSLLQQKEARKGKNDRQL